MRLKSSARAIILVTVGLLLSSSGTPGVFAQTPAAPAPAPAGPPTASKLSVAEGSQARYRVREQLVGISFPNDAVGESSAVTGTLTFRADGTIDASQSKLTVDLRELKSDQEMRDGFIQRRVLETEKFPIAEFVPRAVKGIPYPFPTQPGSQSGFEMVGDLTIHGVTREVTWSGIVTFNEAKVQGMATTKFPFTQFGLTKPSIARLMSVDDTIVLEVNLRTVKSGL